MRARVTWGDQVRDALEQDRFILYQQPILDLAADRVTRHELLLRMVSDDGEVIPPGAFLHIAEESGLIREIDRWVVSEAVALVAAHERNGHKLKLSVNLSGPSVSDPQLLEVVERELSESGIDPTSLIFEVTETAAIINIEKAKLFGRRLADLGCAFALDDFGAGFGSFYYLKHLPFDYLKIDGDFIRNLPDNAPDQLTVQAIVQIARGLHKRTIAEFVESQPTLELLRLYGVDYAQGYHIGRPVPVTESWTEATQRVA